MNFKNKQVAFDRIERYLNGQLDEQDLILFEKKLQEEPLFAKEVRLHQKIHKALGNSKKQALRQHTEVLNKKYAAELKTSSEGKRIFLFSPIFKLVASVAILISAISLAWYFTSKPVNQWADVRIPTSANYEPIAFLEDNNRRGTIADLKDQYYSLQDAINLHLAAQVEAKDFPEKQIENKITLSIYNNKIEDYKIDHKILDTTLVVDENYGFEYDKVIQLDLGLYYYKIETPNKNYIAKFYVLPIENKIK